MGSNERQQRRTLGTFAAGSAAGVVGSAILQPFDVVRTGLQANSIRAANEVVAASKTSAPNLAAKESAVRVAVTTTRARAADVVAEILRRDGVRGLWRGTAASCLRVGLGAGVYFALLDRVLTGFKSWPSIREGSSTGGDDDGHAKQLAAWQTMAAGALTRGLAAAMVCPITVLKTRVEYGVQYQGIFSGIRSIFVKEGAQGLFQGLGVTIIRDGPYSGLYLLLYTRLRLPVQDKLTALGVTNEQRYSSVISGALAAVTATLTTQPPDVVRTKLQLQTAMTSSSGAAAAPAVGIWGTLKGIWQAHGMVGLFRGVGPRVVKRGLQQALTWSIFEELSRKVIGQSMFDKATKLER